MQYLNLHVTNFKRVAQLPPNYSFREVDLDIIIQKLEKLPGNPVTFLSVCYWLTARVGTPTMSSSAIVFRKLSLLSNALSPFGE